MKKPPRRARVLALHAVLIFALWMIGGIVLTGFEFWRLDTFGQFDIDLSDFVTLGMLRGVSWALVTPLVIWVALRVPVQKPRRLRTMLLLIPIVLLLALFREAFGATIAQISMGLPWNHEEILDAWNLRLDVNIMVIAGIIVGTNLVKQQREALEHQRRTAELESEFVRARLTLLQADLKPHFLFNALHGIASLVHADPDEAERMLIALSGFLRRALEAGDSQRIPLSEELVLANEYLEIIRMRFGEKLVFRIDAEEELLEAEVPPLLLQPLVENAIRHGPLANGNDTRVEVIAFADRELLKLQVRDNGSGCELSEALGGGGIGLPNTRKRLELIYGGAASLELRRQSGEFVVELTLPLQRDASLLV
jgi:two-component system, LytTR family, sensor kinase